MSKTNFNIDEIIFTSLNAVQALEKFEYISIFDAIGRILSQNIIAKKALPAFNNSAMDGYAVKLNDRGDWVRIIDESFAGDKISDYTLKNGEAYKIMTGAPTPNGTDLIVPFENIIETKDGSILLPDNLKPNSNMKFQAEEIDEGDILISKGSKLTPNHLALLASQGYSAIEVYKKIKVGIFSTGDEIKEPWEEAKEYQIYNSNSMGLYSTVKEHNFEAIYLGSLGDNIETIKKGFLSAKNECDVLITSGGVSKGEADFIAPVLEMLNAKIFFHGVNVKPGRPNLMAKIDNLIFFGLPGNPLSAIVNFNLFVTPVLYKMAGHSNHYLNFVYAKNLQEFKLKDSRANIVLGYLENGEFKVTRDNKYGSGMLLPLIESNAFIIIDKGVNLIEKDREVKIIPFNNSLINQNISYINQ